MNYTINLSVFIILIGIILYIQYKASQTSSKSGYILPAIFVLFSLLSALGILFFSIDGDNHHSSIMISALMVFIYMNIPTAILLLIKQIAYDNYLKKSNNTNSNTEIDKMNIKDL